MKPLLLSLMLLLSLIAVISTRAALRASYVVAGRVFGKGRSYRRIVSKTYFAINPKLPPNRIINDVRYAPTNAQGLAGRADTGRAGI